MERKTNVVGKPKTRIIFSQRLAGYLMQCGFVLVSMREDLCCTRRNVFLFNESDELEKAIGKYLSKHNT